MRYLTFNTSKREGIWTNDSSERPSRHVVGQGKAMQAVTNCMSERRNQQVLAGWRPLDTIKLIDIMNVHRNLVGA